MQGSRNPGYLRSALIGAAFAVGWTPCIGPILGSILFIACYTHETAKGAALLATYSLGMGIPFLLIGLAWSYIVPFWKGITRYMGAYFHHQRNIAYNCRYTDADQPAYLA